MPHSKLAESSLAYQQHLIESLARSERTTKRNYLALQKAIEDGETQQTIHTTINTAVQITTTERVTDLPHEAARGLEPNAPIVRYDTRIGELLLCFQLLNHLLAYHSTARKEGDLPAPEYDELRSLIGKIQGSDIKHLEAEYVYAHAKIQEEAAKNVHDRLRELTEATSFSGRSYKPAPPPPGTVRPKMKGATRGSVPEPRRQQSVAPSGTSYPPMDNLAVCIPTELPTWLSIDIYSIHPPRLQEDLKSLSRQPKEKLPSKLRLRKQRLSWKLT
jgi:hypothetical protein